MARPNSKFHIDNLRARAIRIRPGTCRFGHEDCEVEEITTAMLMTRAGKTHRISFSYHSATDEAFSSSGPACGSKQIGRGWVAAGTFASEITCAKCK